MEKTPGMHQAQYVIRCPYSGTFGTEYREYENGQMELIVSRFEVWAVFCILQLCAEAGRRAGVYARDHAKAQLCAVHRVYVQQGML